jgi:hypothetical protein
MPSVEPRPANPSESLWSGCLSAVARTSQVKRSTYPPAAWIHNTAAAGMTVHVRTGGNFVASKEELSRPLLLVAGGIGIAPLYSILADAVDRCGHSSLTATLLYMARGVSEQCVKQPPSLSYTTRQPCLLGAHAAQSNTFPDT